MYGLGVTYMNGDGVDAGKPEALQLFRRAVFYNNVNAARALAEVYSCNSIIDNDDNQEDEDRLMAAWFRKKANLLEFVQKQYFQQSFSLFEVAHMHAAHTQRLTEEFNQG